MGQGLHLIRVGDGDIPPEEQPPSRRVQRGRDPRQEVQVHRPQAQRIHERLGAAPPQLERLIGADVDERPGEQGIDGGEPAGDQRQGARVSRRQHVAVRRLAQLRVPLVLQHMVQVPERFLLRHDGDVVLGRVRDQRAGVVGRERATRWGDQRVRRIGERMLEVQ